MLSNENQKKTRMDMKEKSVYDKKVKNSMIVIYEFFMDLNKVNLKQPVKQELPYKIFVFTQK